MKEYKIYKECAIDRPVQAVLFSLSEWKIDPIHFLDSRVHYKLLGIQRYKNGYNDKIMLGEFYFIEDKSCWDEEEFEFESDTEAILYFKLKYPNGETLWKNIY